MSGTSAPSLTFRTDWAESGSTTRWYCGTRIRALSGSPFSQHTSWNLWPNRRTKGKRVRPGLTYRCSRRAIR
jgi:hypothetical protein